MILGLPHEKSGTVRAKQNKEHWVHCLVIQDKAFLSQNNKTKVLRMHIETRFS